MRKAQVDKFLSKSKQLFVVFCKDKNCLGELERKYGVPMKLEDWDYLKSIKSNRKAHCTSADVQWHLDQEIAAGKAVKWKEQKAINSAGGKEDKLDLDECTSTWTWLDDSLGDEKYIAE